MASRAADILGARSILVIPAGVNPQRTLETRTSAADRLAMVRLAFRNEPRARIIDIETTRPGPSFTIDTLRALAASGEGPMRLLIGGDQALNFHRWKEWPAIVQLAEPAVVLRPPHDRASFEVALRAAFAADAKDADSAEADQADVSRWLARVLPIEPVDSNATHARSELAAGREPAELDPEVVAYARRQRLYAHDPSTDGERRWRIERGTERFGPYQASELLLHIAAGRIQPTDLLRESGTDAPRRWQECLGELNAASGGPPSVPPTERPSEAPPSGPDRFGALEYVIPIGRHPMAIFAPYAGLFALGCGVLAPVAIVLGILAWRWTPTGAPGRGRAVTAIVLGIIGGLLWTVIAAIAYFSR